MKNHFGHKIIESRKPDEYSSFREFVTLVNSLPIAVSTLNNMCIFYSTKEQSRKEFGIINAVSDLLKQYEPSDMVQVRIDDSGVSIFSTDIEA